MEEPCATTIIVPFALYCGLVLATAGGMLLLSHVLGEKHCDRTTGRPYESGIEPTGSARGRIPADFYIVGILFVIFDIEAVFVFAWAIAIREAGWVGYLEMLLFLGMLFVALLYLWRVGVLDWNKSRHRRDEGPTYAQ